MLSAKDIPTMKNGRQMLCMMKKLMFHVERAAIEVANRRELVIKRRSWTPQDCKALYDGIAHFFRIPGKQKRRFEQISWKSYYDILHKRKWKLLGEKAEDAAAVATTAAATATTAARARTTAAAAATTAAATATTAARARTTAATATTAVRRRKQTKKGAPAAPTRSSPRQKKQRQRRPRNDAFGAAFAQIPARDERVENTCALGTKCKVFQEPEAYAGLQMQTHKCRGPDCDNEVHHICSICHTAIQSC